MADRIDLQVIGPGIARAPAAPRTAHLARGAGETCALASLATGAVESRGFRGALPPWPGRRDRDPEMHAVANVGAPPALAARVRLERGAAVPGEALGWPSLA